MRKRALLSGFYCPDLVLCQKKNIWKIQINTVVNFFTQHRWIGLHVILIQGWVWTRWKCAIVDCFFSKRRSYIFVFKLTRKLYLLIHSIKRLCNHVTFENHLIYFSVSSSCFNKVQGFSLEAYPGMKSYSSNFDSKMFVTPRLN